ncbi:MAG: BspA family leucine-rich repeat surface protein, partial [Clostridia bacterium]|nr:BspA family leucine-rich repeat surface protein [Clostridia bacterium]
MQEKKKQKKYTIAIALLCVAILVSAGALIGVLAAINQTVKSTFNVEYSVGQNIAVGVRTEYYVPNMDADGDGAEDGAITVTTDSSGNQVETDANGYIVYNAPDDAGDKEVYIGDFTLNPQMQQVVFYFTVKSLMNKGYVRVLFTPNYTTKTNVKVDTYYYNTTSFDESKSASTIADSAWSNVHYKNVDPNGYKMIKVVVSVDDENKKASCHGDFDIALEYSSVNELTTLDTSLISNNYNGESTIAFKYAQETPATAASTLADSTTDKIWTDSDGSTFYVYSKYTIDLPANSSSLFSDYTNLTKIDMTNLNSSNVTNMGYMFNGCTSLANLDLSNFSTDSAVNMDGMFKNCQVLTSIDLSSFNTANVNSMYEMFRACYGLVELDCSSFDTSKVTQMAHMFSYCTSLAKCDVSSFTATKVTGTAYMFWNDSALESLDLSNFGASEV